MLGGSMSAHRVHGIDSEVLDLFGLFHIGQIDQPLDLRRLAEADLSGPPAFAPVPDPLLRHGRALWRYGPLTTGQSRARSKFGEGLWVLAVPDVPGHNRYAIVEVVSEIREDEARGWGAVNCNVRR